MTKIDALLDSNVVIAALAVEHQHHVSSLELFTGGFRLRFAVAAHSYAEVYTTLTRRGGRAQFHFTAEEAWAALESVRAVTALVGLTAPQTFDTVRKFARSGGIGARLYDQLIGETALIHGVPMIITWNIGHMRSLFPSLSVVTPQEVTLPQ